MLNLYLLHLECLRAEGIKFNTGIAVNDLRYKGLDLYNRLDPSIRIHIQKRGINIKQNTYIGFDTEFTSKDLNYNHLVSAQLALTTKTYVYVPLTPSYKLSLLDENTNKLKKINKSSLIFNYLKIETSIQQSIAEIRKIKYEKHDVCMKVLVESLKMIKGLSYYEGEEQIVFSLPRSLIQPYIHFGSSFSFKELIQISSGLAKTHHDKSCSTILELIKDICDNDFSLAYGKEKLVESI